MKTQVEVLYDTRYGAAKKGERGYIDGYCRGADDCGYCMVVIGERIEMIEPRNLKAILEHEQGNGTMFVLDDSK